MIFVNTMSCQDVEMFSLRRSSRLADKERQKFLNNNAVEEPKNITPKPARKKSDVVKMSVDKKAGVNTKKKTRKARKVKKNANKFMNLEKTRINDVFPLIYKYSQTESEKVEKYFVLQTIIKFRKEININNLMTDVYIHKHAIERYVYLHLAEECTEVTLLSVSNHLDDILSYKEIDDLDTVIRGQTTNTHKEPRFCDNIVDSLNIMNISSKEATEEQMKKDMDEIEKLNSMICRLMM